MSLIKSSHGNLARRWLETRLGVVSLPFPERSLSYLGKDPLSELIYYHQHRCAPARPKRTHSCMERAESSYGVLYGVSLDS